MSTPTLHEILEVSEDAESWDGPWDDGWGAVSGDEDDAPQDLFEETPDQGETEPQPGDEADATGGDAEPGMSGWGAPIEDAPHDAPPTAPLRRTPPSRASGPGSLHRIARSTTRADMPDWMPGRRSAEAAGGRAGGARPRTCADGCPRSLVPDGGSRSGSGEPMLCWERRSRVSSGS